MDKLDTMVNYTPYPGNDSQCRVRIYDPAPAPGPVIVMITELPDNPGMSVTNASELIAGILYKRYALDPGQTRFIEHYPALAGRDGHPETFDEIFYTWQDGAPTAPHWRRLAVEEVERLTGETWGPAPTLTEATNQIAQSMGFEWIQDDWTEV